MLGISTWILLTSPISENKISKDYKKLNEILYSEKFLECISEANKIKYISDFEAYGVEDYWQTPEETKSCGTGDCEDWAKNLQDLASKRGINLNLWYGERNLGDTAHVSTTLSCGTQTAFIEKITNPDTIKIIIKDSIIGRKYIPFYFSKEMRKSNQEYKQRTGKKFFN